jgi:hypothetical protein
MAKLLFNQAGDNVYEHGVRNCVLYVKDVQGGDYPLGVPWNGLMNVSQSPTGGEATPFYADNIKYANLLSKELLEGSLEAYTYPDEFAVCDGSADIGGIASGVKANQQPRKEFGISYKTRIGNDLDAELGYKIHLIYGMLAAPSERSADTINESPELATFSWNFTTSEVEIAGFDRTASLEIDSRTTDPTKLALIEDLLYGTDGPTDAELPLPDEIIAILEAV